MRQSDFKKIYDPELGRFTRQHIYGEGVMDVLKNFGSKILGQALKKAAKTAATQKLVGLLESISIWELIILLMNSLNTILKLVKS